jgi:hypothetical protein
MADAEFLTLEVAACRFVVAVWQEEVHEWEVDERGLRGSAREGQGRRSRLILHAQLSSRRSGGGVFQLSRWRVETVDCTRFPAREALVRDAAHRLCAPLCDQVPPSARIKDPRGAEERRRIEAGEGYGRLSDAHAFRPGDAHREAEHELETLALAQGGMAEAAARAAEQTWANEAWARRLAKTKAEAKQRASEAAVPRELQRPRCWEASVEQSAERQARRAQREAAEEAAASAAGSPPSPRFHPSVTEPGRIFHKLCDSSLYTGTHKHRFDRHGQGRGLAGRDRLIRGRGSKHGRWVTHRMRKEYTFLNREGIFTCDFGRQRPIGDIAHHTGRWFNQTDDGPGGATSRVNTAFG